MGMISVVMAEADTRELVGMLSYFVVVDKKGRK